MNHSYKLINRKSLALSLSLVIGSAVSLNGWATDAVDTKTDKAAEQSVEQSNRALTIPDMLAWNSAKQVAMSDDGKWFAYIAGPAEEGNAELTIKQIDGDKEYRFPSGNTANRGRISFSEDGKWLTFDIAAPYQPAGPRGPQGAGPKGKLGLVSLEDGELKEFEDVQGYQFAGERTTWLAMQKAPSGQAPRGRGMQPGAGNGGKPSEEPASGRDLILHNLDSDVQINIGNVSEFAFDEEGENIAWIVDSEGQSGNGVQIRNLKTDVARVLDSGDARYKQLSWANDKNALTFLKGEKDKGYEELLYSVVGIIKPGAKTPEKTVFNPHENADFPKDYSISANTRPYWNEDLNTLVFGIAEVTKVEMPAGKKPPMPQGEAPESDEEPGSEQAAKSMSEDKEQDKPAKPKPKVSPAEKPGLVLWHWKDDRLQSEQQKQAGRDKNRTYLASYSIKTKTFVRIADEQVPSVQTTSEHKWGVGFDDSAYSLLASLRGKNYFDIYRVNLATGERIKALEKIRWGSALSPKGRYYLYYLNGHYHTLELATGKVRNITKGVDTSFINVEDDHNQVDPPYQAIGWAKGEKWVLLSDGWDIWKVSATGGRSENLTRDGKQKQIRYSNVTTYDEDARQDGIDLSRDLYVSAYGEWTKKSGFGLIKKGVEMLKWGEAKYAMPRKAKDANVFVYSSQTPTEYPDFYWTDASFKTSERLTDINPDQDEFAWTAGARLIDFTTDKGVKLQASLTLPADYEPGKKYPTIVYIYEKLSQNMNSYAMPSVRGFNLSYYTSNGYAVLQPDIVYEIDNPGMSAVWAVLPALKAAIDTGIVDEDRVGLHGHSWGGYQSSFLATQTNAFKAIVTGAPLTNMISMYGINYWNSGVANGAIFEDLQGRFSSHYLDVPEAYTRNSPVLFADQVQTPMVILHNDKDGAVDWNQGVEYYNILRRLGKEVVMLQYVGENHGVVNAANRKDYTVRMKEFFDHHLKGEQAPDWWQDGVPYLDMDEHVEERVADLKLQAMELKKSQQIAKNDAAGKAPSAEGEPSAEEEPSVDKEQGVQSEVAEDEPEQEVEAAKE
ncbi:prolyl oligopeptidase family serine peptidase [Porticoccaceae bacterium LTM1]|nr:prolyl oligopeptidase family serine peptidase [Porticoccaceae bacterium LTM1]